YFFGGRTGTARCAIILAASLVFYGCWDVRFLSLLLGSIIVNYAIGRRLRRDVAEGRQRRATALLVLGVTVNLVVLGVFKYARFMVANINALTGADITLGRIILPLGISFFTFEQIGFLTDLRRGAQYRLDPLRYAVFVAFFPRLVAGPILRYGEIVPQLEPSAGERHPQADLAIGLTIFAIGLAKKALLADGIAPFVAGPFASAGSGDSPDLFLAWGGVLAYTCQLYFDFSGYSDMAIGAARCFGIRFPVNFNSPYKSTSIIEFWHRWHITLSRFLRDYLYISLGGNRRGPVRRYMNLLATMLLGGLWHGANWTFLLWGGLHGTYLMINHALLRLRGLTPFRAARAGAAAGFVLTFLAVVVSWVFFRAPSLHAAVSMLKAMAGMNGAQLPDAIIWSAGPFAPIVGALGIRAGGSGTVLVQTWMWVLALLALALLAPNTQEILAAAHATLEQPAYAERRLRWSLSVPWAIAAGAVAFFGVLSITRAGEFLYWQF
ncbi:MAG: MBOAT family protein, partial [Acetobacteraceae bacterium]|nr:MBOAT family protein [Acetobacteraceae bacterium]